MDTNLLIFCTTNSITIFLLITILSKKRGDISPSVKAFTVSILSLVTWSACNYFADTSNDHYWGLFWTRAAFPPALLMGLSITYFSNIFPSKQRYSPKTYFIYSFFVIFFTVASLYTFIIQDVTITKSGISNVRTGVLYPGILVVYLIFIAHSTKNFIASYKRLSGKNIHQIKYTLFGWTTFLSFAITTNAILPYITGDTTWSKFGPLGSVVMVACISYAIIRHQFLDIKFIIQRGLVYSILLFCVTTIYLGTVFALESILNYPNEISMLIGSFITTIVGIFGVPPLKLYFETKTDSIFFKGRYNYAHVLSELTEVLNQNISLRSITEKTSHILTKSLKADLVLFHISKKNINKETDSSLLFPISSYKKRIGYLELGPKKSGDPYSSMDISLIETFTKQAAIALEKASLYAQVKEYANTLEKKVEERTKELSASEEEKEALMLEISHGLQTPLTIMKGELFFLRKQGVDTERVEAIDSSIDRISNFIYRLLSLARLEGSQLSPKENINLSTLLHDLINFFTITSRENDITFKNNIESDIYIYGNKEELNELISNLLSNAIKYMSKNGEKSVTLSARLEKNNAIIIVSDTGIGMSSDDSKKLFSKFYRIKNETTKGIKGTGLGLSICKKIVDIHHGTIHVTSTLGKGTDFVVRLPTKPS